MSFGIPVGDVPSMVDHPRLVTAIARDLYVEGVDIAANERFINLPQVAPDPSPYERAVAGRARTARSARGLGAGSDRRSVARASEAAGRLSRLSTGAASSTPSESRAPTLKTAHDAAGLKPRPTTGYLPVTIRSRRLTGS